MEKVEFKVHPYVPNDELGGVLNERVSEGWKLHDIHWNYPGHGNLDTACVIFWRESVDGANAPAHGRDDRSVP